MHYFCGIEGGATHSTVVLLNSEGVQLAQLDNEPPSNHWLQGMEGCCEELAFMVKKVCKKAGLEENVPLTGLGLCLSGCEEEKTNEELKRIMQSKLPFAQTIVVASDTVGPLAAASDSGGIVLISGTGSNCLLINPDNSQARCGGWGYMLGDEGAAWWIASKAVKTCIDDQDKFAKAPHCTDYVWHAIRTYFQVEDRFGMLEHNYKRFNKSDYAGLTLHLSKGAEKGDALCQFLFHQAGEALGKHILSVRPSIDPKLHEGTFGLPIVCVGSVWKSWKHLSPGFLKVLGLNEGQEPLVTKFSLLRLTVNTSFGAALLSARSFDIPKNFANYVKPFYSHGVGLNIPVDNID